MRQFVSYWACFNKQIKITRSGTRFLKGTEIAANERRRGQKSGWIEFFLFKFRKSKNFVSRVSRVGKTHRVSVDAEEI